MQGKEKFSRFRNRQDKADEFGFTGRYAEGARRIINRKGDFNVIRKGEKKTGLP